MKKLEKWLTHSWVQRLVYLLLLLSSLYVLSTSGTLSRAGTFTRAGASSMAVVAGIVLVLGTQLIWNRKWLWGLLCGMMLCFTLWLATLNLSQIISGAGTPARTVVWGVGVIGFTLLLILLLAFMNWMLLHMKPKR